MMIMPDGFQYGRYSQSYNCVRYFSVHSSPTQFLGGRSSQALIIILNAVGIALAYYRSL